MTNIIEVENKIVAQRRDPLLSSSKPVKSGWENSLFVLNSLNYEVLSGDKDGISSIRIDHKYRLEFKVEKNEKTIITVCNILDITNHYK